MVNCRKCIMLGDDIFIIFKPYGILEIFSLFLILFYRMVMFIIMCGAGMVRPRKLSCYHRGNTLTFTLLPCQSWPYIPVIAVVVKSNGRKSTTTCMLNIGLRLQPIHAHSQARSQPRTFNGHVITPHSEQQRQMILSKQEHTRIDNTNKILLNTCEN